MLFFFLFVLHASVELQLFYIQINVSLQNKSEVVLWFFCILHVVYMEV